MLMLMLMLLVLLLLLLLLVVVCQHWIRLEMQPDVLVSLLTMSVEPTDSSYMPSLLVVSAGNSTQSLQELRTVNVEPHDRRIILLDNLSQVSLNVI